jgi:YegS/Rv2252/BmrU family lipid kinase
VSLSAHVIFNPVAGQGQAEADLVAIRQSLGSQLDLVVHKTQPQTDVTALARQSIAAGAEVVVAAGGDGTVAAVAAALVQKSVPLAIIPRGTANAFATAMGVPTAVPKACDLIVRGHPQPVDVAQCNDQLVLSEVDIGFEAETLKQVDRQSKKRWGPLAYTLNGLRQLRRQQPFQATLEADGQLVKTQAVAIAIANAVPFSSLLAQGPPDVEPQDGWLDITVVKPWSYVGMAKACYALVMSYLRDRSTQSQYVQSLRAKTLRVTTTPTQRVAVDGDLLGTTDVSIRCIPSGLQVYYPA